MLRLLVLSAAFALFGVSANAGDPIVTVELNKLEPNGDACRAYLMLHNGAGAAFDSLKLDLVLLDNDGIVANRLAVETAPLKAGKTSLKVFDFADQQCGEVGRVLLNDVLACHDNNGPRQDCLDVVAPTSLGSVAFIK
ncbi:MAG: Tat pathway signal sequence domain protein [Pseudomonadota bacterium]